MTGLAEDGPDGGQDGDGREADVASGGEVVYDSILLNKQKTKSYWEQLMMAAAAPSPGPGGSAPVCPQARGDLPSLEQAGSEVSEQEYFDARSSVSPSEPAEPAEPQDEPQHGAQHGAKVVEAVAKVESVVQRDIRQQREREEQLAREREAALDLLRDDGFVSIPTSAAADEGDCSEYGSEGKEHSLDGSSSRVMSPEVGALPHHHHQRTQSMDSTSSGHSSGSGSGSGSGSSGFNGRRRVTVKPLAEPEEQSAPAFVIRPTNETPIEREIRLSREREAELAREKALRVTTEATETAEHGVAVVESVRHATSRIQQEISRASEREQELRHSKESPAQRSPEFPGRVKLKKAVSTSHLLAAVEQAAAARPPLRRLGSSTASPVGGRAPLGRSVSTTSSPATPPALTLGAPRRFAPNPSQKGLMQRFLASRGKMSSAGLVNGSHSPGSGPLSPTATPPSPAVVHVPLSATATAKMAALVDSREGRESSQEPAPVRRGYTSAEDKIQEELKEMRRREEELRLQRARTFARSQPNLLSLLDDVVGPDSTTLNESSSPVIDKLPAMAVLRSALSNPNLLDEEAHNNNVDTLNEKNLQKNVGIRKKNALIAEWENRIQQHIEH